MKKILALLVALMLTMTLTALAEEPSAEPGAAATAAVDETDTADEAAAAGEAAGVDEAAAADEIADVDETAAADEAEEEPYTGVATASRMITIVALLAVMLAGLFLSARRVKWDAAMIARAALCIALAYLLDMVVLWRAPMGGSVTLVSMLPLILFAVAYGPLEGLLIGFVFGLLDLLINPYVIHPVQLLVDYPMAYGAVALACLAKVFPLPERWKLPLAVFFGYLGRYIMAVISGVVFFAEYAGEQGALVYSLLYNGGYLWPEAVACMLVALIPGVARLPKRMRERGMR